MDFEEALANAWSVVFPKCLILRDFFHLQQANTRQLQRLGLSDNKADAVNDIRALWYSDTKVDFDSHLNVFLIKWDQSAPQYAEYFRRVWMGQYSPHEWASFARPHDAPSGLYLYFCFVFASTK
jgi:hypothetical protein